MTLAYAARAMLFAALFVVQLVCALKEAQDYVVLPELIPGLSSVEDARLIPDMFAGHIPLDSNEDEHTKNYFFWKFHDKSGRASPEAQDTLIFWLNGGPGCSSMDGALMESGALRIDSSGKAYLNEGGWHTRGDIVFVDQPAGTGFSTVGSDQEYDNDLEVVAQHFLAFLRNYFTIFPGDLSKQVILAGESYAGQFIPFFARAILDQDAIDIDLQALLIGNGWIDPNHQSLYYIPFAIEKGLLANDNPKLPSLLAQQEVCQNKINADGNEQFSFKECEDLLSQLLEITRRTQDSEGKKVPANEQCINMYDLRLKDSYPSCGMNWPEDLPNLSKFFGTPGVVDALHLDPEHVPNWHECDDSVSRNLKNPNSRPSANLLPALLESGLQVILFNGDQDIICNNMGVESLISELSWGGEKGFSDQVQYYDWVYQPDGADGTPAGFVKYDRNLTFISVYNASHMVPFDNGPISRGIVDIVLNNVELVQGDKGDTLVSESYNSDESFSSLDCEGKDKDTPECKELAIQKAESEEADADGSSNEGATEDEVENVNNSDGDGGDDDKEDGNDEPKKDEDDKEDDDHKDDDNKDDDNKDDDHEDDDHEDDDHEDDDHEDDESNESHTRITVISILISATIIAGLYYAFRERFRPKLRAILVDPESRPDSGKKTVSWASDLEQDGAETNAASQTKKKGAYTSVPTNDTRGSFELDDL